MVGYKQSMVLMICDSWFWSKIWKIAAANFGCISAPKMLSPNHYIPLHHTKLMTHFKKYYVSNHTVYHSCHSFMVNICDMLWISSTDITDGIIIRTTCAAVTDSFIYHSAIISRPTHTLTNPFTTTCATNPGMLRHAACNQAHSYASTRKYGCCATLLPVPLWLCY